MDANFFETIDFQRINGLLENFNRTTGFVTAILTLEGEVLSKSGWRSVCNDFHRVNPETAHRCKLSDTELSGKMSPGETYHFYTCLNGLVDVAVPLVIGGKHVANLFSGQFFLEEPDLGYFRNQAVQFGFDEEVYLKKIREVPVVDIEKVKPAMEFLLRMTEMIAEASMQHLQRGQLNEALQHTEARYYQLFRSMLDGCALHEIILDASGKPVDYRFLEINPAFEQITGFKADQIIGKTIREIMPDIENYWIEVYGKVALTGEPEHFTNLSQDLKKRFEVTAFCPRKRQFACIFSDITERLKTEQSLRESGERLDFVLKGSQLGYWDWDIVSGMVYRNRIWAEMLGYTLEDIELNVKQWTDLHHPDDKDAAWKSIHDHLEGRTEEHKIEYRMRTKDGNYKWILDQASIVQRDADGKPLRMSGTHTDITARKMAEQEINRLNAELEDRVKQRTAQLESANKELESFSYSVSHDLRAPLRAINGYSAILKEDYARNLDEEGLLLLDTIIDNTRKMSELIDDLLRLSRIAKQELIRVPINMREMIRSVFDELSNSLPPDRIHFSLADLPDVKADKALVRIAVTNLLSNALKFSSKEQVQHIEIGYLTGENEVYYIRDNGVGFNMAYAGKLFEVFQRLHRADEFEGTGIGLAIVHRIIRKHGGEIYVESEPGKGACFYFSFQERDKR